MSVALIDGETLRMLRAVSNWGLAPPWRAMVEGRDLVSGESFVMIGEGSDRDEDLYLTRESGVASVADHDLVALSRNYLDVLIDEVERLGEELARLVLRGPASVGVNRSAGARFLPGLRVSSRDVAVFGSVADLDHSLFIAKAFAAAGCADT